ncbi:MAG: DUF5615 family PIN-like protein [Phycisphaerae bacterium]|nr:DUF5615 family PIN-like protein [Phycisphaerae bacterium]
MQPEHHRLKPVANTGRLKTGQGVSRTLRTCMRNTIRGEPLPSDMLLHARTTRRSLTVAVGFSVHKPVPTARVTGSASDGSASADPCLPPALAGGTIWIDAQLPPAPAHWLNHQFGVDAQGLDTLGLRHATDMDIQAACRPDHVIMTKDEAFFNIAPRRR